MRKIKDIQAEKKKLHAAYRAAAKLLDEEMAQVRAENAKAKSAKAEDRKPQDTTKESARRAADAAKERMKADHPDHGGTSEAFRASYKQWKQAEARYQAAA
jgi:hypothetical protein